MPKNPISTVHVVFKTHLDIGFTDYAHNVVDRYMQCYIPSAVATAREMRESGEPERFVWTTGSWLIHEYLERAKGSARKAMENAIAAGDIAWHGLPCTTHTELLDPELFRYGLSLSKELDARFGRKTIAAKMTDVPGHTRSIIPYLAEAGIRFLHIGVNAACRPPEVPPVFRWKHPSGKEIVVVYNTGYGGILSLPELKDAILFAHTGDNHGPQPADEIRTSFSEWRAQYPGATVKASTLDAFAKALLSVSKNLPVVDGEIGDSWIHGVGTDPWKVAALRELLRRRTAWLAEKRLNASSKEYRAFCGNLLLVAEHTWGFNEERYLNDFKNYTRKDFEAARRRDRVTDDACTPETEYARQFRVPDPRYSVFESSWDEQRDYIRSAVASLKGTKVAKDAKDALSAVTPKHPSRAGFKPSAPDAVHETPDFSVRLDPTTGALSRLVAQKDGRVIADARHHLGTFSYQTFSQADYDRYLKQYTINMKHDWCWVWAIPDLSKPGIAAAGAESAWWTPTVSAISQSTSHGVLALRAELAMPDKAVNQYGAPRVAMIDYVFPEEAPRVEITLRWFGKAANRMPETLWFSFVPKVTHPEQWTMDKLGCPVNPGEVVRSGNRELHAIGRGVSHTDGKAALRIESLDAALVAPGTPSILNFHNRQPDMKKGWHFNLYNNQWGTNFPMWSDEDGQFRFIVSL